MDKLLTPKEVCALVPGMTETKLRDLRYAGGGPLFLKPTPRTVVYRESAIAKWLDSVEHDRTDRLAASAS